MVQAKILYLTLCMTLGTSCASEGLPRPEQNQANNPTSAVQDVGTDALKRLGNPPPLDSSAVSIQCIGGKTCWINSPRIIWRSLDDGKSWEQIYHAPSGEEIEGIDFVGPDAGWLISTDKLFFSNNGGSSWAEVPTPFQYPNGEVRSLSFLDGRTGWLAGGVYRAQTAQEIVSGVPPNTRDLTGKRVLEEAIYRTNDGGRSWQAQSLPKAIGRITRIQFLNEQRGLALGENAVYFATDGGNKWREVSFKKGCTQKEHLSDYYEADPSNVAMLDELTWWVAYDDGRIIKTVDGGREWCDLINAGTVDFEASAGSPTFFKQIHFDTPEHGWGLGSDRFLYETKDGGNQWLRVTSKVRFESFAFTDNNTGLLVSDSGIFRISP